MKKFNFKNRKHIALSLVAFILIMMMTVGVTYSWIDDAKQVQISTIDDADNKTPLKTGVDINAKVSVTKKTNTINLGNMLKDEDTKYTEDDKSHLRYDGSDSSKKYDKDNIKAKKGYFYESGDMHLSGCYSDGEYFYFPKSNGSYREGNKDDENVNYISFTTQVSSPYADVDFWFKNQPKIYKHGTSTAISQARYAVSVNGQSHVYSSSGSATTCSVSSSGTITGTTGVSGVRKTSAYTYNHDDNTTDSLGKNSNVLFSIKKGDTVNVTIKIWIENDSNFDTSITASDINMELVSSWAYTRKITIVDRTTNGSGTSWIDDDSAKLYVTIPSFLEDRTDSVANWNSITASDDYSIPFVEINNSTYKHTDTDSESVTYNYYELNIPLVFNNAEMVIYRSQSWNVGNHSGQTNDHGVTYWNWWRTYLPNTYTSATYTIYGSSMDEVAHNRFGDSAPQTFKGYGTWGGVEHIKVYSHYGSTDYASKSNGANLFVRDHSDEATSGEIYTYVMYRADNGTSTPWQVYLPKSSALIQFHYYLNDSTKGTWGYKSWSEENRQQRPLASSGLYDSDSTEYHFAQNYGTDQGWGYWEGADTVYLIKSSFLSDNSITPHAYMFTGSTNQSAYPGPALSRLKDTSNNYVSYTWNGGQYTAQVWKLADGVCRVYKNIIFNNGDSNGGGDDQIGVKKTGTLNLFPGCFYQVDGSHWYGSLTDTGRSASESTDSGSGGGSSGDSGSDSISGYTVDSGFTVQLNGNTYTVYTNSSESEFKVRLPLTAGNNWTTFQKNSLNYGLNASGQEYSVPKSSGLNIYLVKGISNNISLKASSAGNYIVTFTYDNGNTNTIKIDSAVIES